LRRVLEDQSGYYVIGFQPSEADADRIARERQYRRLVLKVRRADVRVRYRKEYMGGSPAGTPADRLLAAVNSPFAEAGLRVRLTPMYIYEGKGQTAVRALLHIDGSGLQFGAADANGNVEAKLRIVAITEGEGGATQTTERMFAVPVKAADTGRGLLCTLRHEVKRPGAYQVRIGVLDTISGNIGSASGFLEIPDAMKRPALSSILMSGGDEDPVGPAVRVFQREHKLLYSVTAYRAVPGWKILPRLLSGDSVVWEGKPIPVPPGESPERSPVSGMFLLGERTTVGDYQLEVRLTDGQRVLAAQRIDFELK
jgi:hypothetical protein